MARTVSTMRAADHMSLPPIRWTIIAIARQTAATMTYILKSVQESTTAAKNIPARTVYLRADLLWKTPLGPATESLSTASNADARK